MSLRKDNAPMQIMFDFTPQQEKLLAVRRIAERDKAPTGIVFAEAALLPPAPPKPLTKRQRRRLRGKS